jgi:hypothetical protein
MITRDEAITATARILRDASAERDALASSEGPRAVADAAHYPGHPAGSAEAIERQYRARQNAAAQRAA